MSEPNYPDPKSFVFPIMENVAFSGAGLTKRELFAAMATIGSIEGLVQHWDPFPAEVIAVAAVKLADALIAELAKEPTP